MEPIRNSKLIGYLASVGTSALSINGFVDQPAMRVPLIVATIAAWFTVALVFLSSLQVYSLERHELVRHFLLVLRANVS